MPRLTKLTQAELRQAEVTFENTMEMVAGAISNAQIALALSKPRSMPSEERLELTNEQLDLLKAIVRGLTNSYGWWTEDYTAEDFVKSVGLIPEYLD